MNSMSGFGNTKGPSGSNIRGEGNIVPKGYKLGQLQQFSPEQMRLFSQLFSHVSPDSFLSGLSGGDESAFQQMEAPAWRNFERGLGQLGSRFSGMGLGARGGSGFQNAATQYTSDFAQDLASRRQELQRQAIMDLMGLSSNLLGQRPYERFLIQKPEKESSGWGGLIGAGLGGTAGFFAGGPAGALAGGTLGYNMGSKF